MLPISLLRDNRRKKAPRLSPRKNKNALERQRWPSLQGRIIVAEAMLSLAQRRLRRGQAGDGHAVGTATDVIQARLRAEFHAGRIAALLAADADFQILARGATLLHGHLDQLADAALVDGLERVGLQQVLLQIGAEEAADVIAAEAERHL